MSRSIRKTFLAALAGIALSLGAGNAAASFIDTFTYDLNLQNGAIAGSGPLYGTVEVGLISSTEAEFIFEATSPYAFLDGGAADVNLNLFGCTSNCFTATIVSLTNPGTPSPFSSGNADGFGSYNLKVSQQNASQPTTEISFTVTLLDTTNGTWSSASNVLIANNDGHHVAAHMVNTTAGSCVPPTQTTDNTSCTGFVTDGPLGETVPIPAAAWLFGSGLLGLIAVARRRITGMQSTAFV